MTGDVPVLEGALASFRGRVWAELCVVFISAELKVRKIRVIRTELHLFRVFFVTLVARAESNFGLQKMRVLLCKGSFPFLPYVLYFPFEPAVV